MLRLSLLIQVFLLEKTPNQIGKSIGKVTRGSVK